MNQNFFSKNEFHSTAEMEMSTESILRFWSPSKDGTEMHSLGQEPEKGLDFEHEIQRIYGGLGIYTAASEEELNKTMHKLSALHHLQFDFTAAVNGSQVQREKSHLNDLYIQCNEAEVIEVEGVSEEHKPISHLSTDEDNMDNWTDTALLKVLLEPCSPKSGLRKRSDQMSSDLDNCIYGNNEVEAGKTEISVPAVRLTERRNSIHDNNELVNQGRSFTRLSPHPFRDEESLNECEPDMDLSSEMRIKVPGDQEFNSVLSELSNSILTSESVGAEGSLEGQSPGTHWKTIKNCDTRYLDITGYKQMETSATECSSETSNSRTLSFSRVVSNLQH
ncbi:uncharacterized protein LOC127578470 [Pristis pectinata]|uniref:uncharacterized protein LOC127578470 n=1 Tax=Pristis pectinata TaxID=685728 RepID=UPI00223CA52A|nr:uncharacterized protein LOC127578470 [Pristis pectinata]